MTEIKLYNTRTRRKEVLKPLDWQDDSIPESEKKVRMYVCGPTVYDRAHIGNARPVIVFDTLFRLLRHVYGPDHVTYARNFTDVDDKINARAAETGRSIRQITDETTQWYLDDMGALGALEPNEMPRATEYIAEMVKMIGELVAKGHAYAAEGHVLFDVNSYEHYGTLSGRSVKDMIAGARVEVAPYKRDPMDFVLWKPSSDDLPGWEGPVVDGKSVGRGRPGWHIECSAMSRALFGEKFDIHGGGLDLQFPHHENEKAQSCALCGEDCFAQVWMHNEMLQVEGKKMSKSLGNFFSVRDLLDQGIPGEVIRFVFLSTHYRKPMDWTQQKRREAAKELEYWATTLSVDHELLDSPQDPGRPVAEVVEALADDLNTSLALTKLRNSGRFIDNSDEFLSLSDASQLQERRNFVASASLLGFDVISLAKRVRSQPISTDLEYFTLALINERNHAMESKDFSKVDRLKAGLINIGVEVRMSKDGVELVPGPNFDRSKLEGLK